MRRLAVFVLIACSSFTLGITIATSWRFISGESSPSSSNTADSRLTKQPGYSSVFATEEFDLASEISFIRIHDGCEGCADRKIVIKRPASKRFEEATVTETDLHSKAERHGKLNPYYFSKLLRLIEEQGCFSMNNEYSMGWVDATMVRLDVSIGERHKTIKTRNEGDVPIQLWGIYYAIEGATTNVDWQASSVPQPNKPLERTRQ